MPRYLRYSFPGPVPASGWPDADARARAMAAVFLDLPEHELRPGRLDTAAALLVDPGGTDYVQGDPMGEPLAPWLRIVVGPGGRTAYLDCDVEAMAHIQAAAERRRTERVS